MKKAGFTYPDYDLEPARYDAAMRWLGYLPQTVAKNVPLPEFLYENIAFDMEGDKFSPQFAAENLVRIASERGFRRVPSVDDIPQEAYEHFLKQLYLGMYLACAEGSGQCPRSMEMVEQLPQRQLAAILPPTSEHPLALGISVSELMPMLADIEKTLSGEGVGAQFKQRNLRNGLQALGYSLQCYADYCTRHAGDNPTDPVMLATAREYAMSKLSAFHSASRSNVN